MAGTTGSVNLVDGALGGEAIKTVTIASQQDTTAGIARIEHSADAHMLYFNAAPTFAGTTRIGYTLSGEHSLSASATVTVHVVARPDPSQDQDVTGLINSQVQTANRMAETQIRNFQQRLEQLHSEGACRKDSVMLNLGLAGEHFQPKLDQQLNCSPSNFSSWTNGEINFGHSDDDKSKQLSHTSIGVSGGVDYRFSPFFTGGVGFGYGKDTSDVGEKGTQSRSNMLSIAAYGSYRPNKVFFLDGVVGYGRLNFQSDRNITATGQMANGRRDGQQIFESLSSGYEYRKENWLLSPYLRVNAAQAKLSGFREKGAGLYNLTYGNQTSDLLSTTFGLRDEYTILMSWGELKPKARFEYTHDFAGNSRLKLGYADAGGLLPYTINAESGVRDRFRVEAGFDAEIHGDWSLGFDYSSEMGSGSGALQHGVRMNLSKQF